MAYTYLTSPIHRIPVPGDDTPQDAQSWGHLVDTLAVGIPFLCASQTEQDEYLARLNADGLGPSAARIVRVCRVDLDALIMRNDGRGWVRDMGGNLVKDAAITSAGSMGGGQNRGVISVAINTPCAALVTVMADLKVEPLSTGGGWNLGFGLRDQAGVGLTTTRWYNKGDGLGQPFNAILMRAVQVPAGATTIHAFAATTPESGGLMLSNASISVTYA